MTTGTPPQQSGDARGVSDVTTGMPLSMGAFCEWVREVIGSPDQVRPGAEIAALLTGDTLRHFALVRAFDELTESDAVPSSELLGVSTVREMYLHYLYVIAKPPEEQPMNMQREMFRPADPLSSLKGKRLSLVPLTQEYYRAAYELAISPDVGFRWRFHGAVPQYDTFERNLFTNVFQQFAVIPDGEPRRFAGLVVAYNANLQDQHTYIATVVQRSYGAGLIEAVALFVRNLFTLWPFQKLYAEVAEFNVPQFASAIRAGLMKEEGRLKKHRFYGNEWWDEMTFAIYREDVAAFNEGHPLMFREEMPHVAGSVEASVQGPDDH